MRAARLVQLLLLLQVHGKLTATQLAERLEVSVRTIYRDLEALSGAGVPVFAESGPGGGVTLIDGYRTRLTGLTPDEAEALALAGLPSAAADLGLGTVLAAAQLKMDAALPPELRRRALRVRERFHLDAAGWFARDETAPHLATIARAVWEERRIDIEYARGDTVVDRTVDPLGLVLKGGRWYLVAGAGEDNAPRTYRASRVRSATLRDERTERAPDFDLATYWDASAEAFARSMLRHEVRARIRATSLWALRRAVDPVAGELILASAGQPDSDGWIEVVVPTESFDYAHHDLLRLGAHIEVLEPLELREHLAATARAMTELYDAG
ncbi:MAG TPA: YafY family protein [Acidimicrobiales bacterium]|jgi:predicted DNA-binding transcriptional regulator YafY